MRPILPLIFLAACSHPRQACYAQAEAAAVQEAMACKGPWKDCPERPLILAKLKAQQERCK